MLDVNPGTVCRLIDLAREFHAEQELDVADDAQALDDDWQARIIEPHTEDPILEEFCSLIDDLNPDQQQQVVGLLWLGRGDYELDEWDELLEYAEQAWNRKTGEYLLAHPMLAEHLTVGLERHGYSCAEF
ncbi:MAG: DUF3775 domain-containing protein [Wenzhouxiangellaceae bacterium]|nr:DUF3775 domain-containing protein [Wenzhouxiangellaceae bacterium]